MRKVLAAVSLVLYLLSSLVLLSGLWVLLVSSLAAIVAASVFLRALGAATVVGASTRIGPTGGGASCSVVRSVETRTEGASEKAGAMSSPPPVL